MKIIVALCMLTSFPNAAEESPPDILRVELEGLKGFESSVTISHKIEVPPDTTTQLISLGCATSGLAIIGTRMIINGSKEGQANVVPLAVGTGLVALSLFLNKWSKQGPSDETVQQDQEEPLNDSIPE